MTHVAVVGLGKMGEPIAERVADAGFALCVFNRSPGPAQRLAERGAAVLPSAAEALAVADVCVTMLSDDDALLSVAGEVLARARPGTVLVDMGTVSVAASVRVAQAAAAAGVDYLRAPVSGNPVVVRAGNLLIVASGPAGALERVAPVLDAIGRRTIHVGEGEQARVVKLALAVIIASTAGILAEAIALGEANDVSRADLLEVVAASAVGSPFVQYKTAPLVAGDYSATFTTAMMVKDLELALTQAREGGVGLPVSEYLRDLYAASAAAGHADQDLMALLLYLRERGT